MKRAMARRVAGRVDEADAGSDFRLARDLTDVLPGREYGLHPAREPSPRLGQTLDDRRVGPELVFDVRYDDFDVGEDRLVGVLLHQAEDVVGVEMGNQDGVDLGRID